LLWCLRGWARGRWDHAFELLRAERRRPVSQSLYPTHRPAWSPTAHLESVGNPAHSYEIYEYACHEGNTAVRNYIETSRFERAEAAPGQ
jgi:hypothetical protein